MTEQQDESVRIKSPYLIPLDEPVMLSFSGGRSSGYLLNNTLEVNGGQPDNLHIVFANTGKEMPQTLDFVRDCAINLNCKITWLEYRFDFEKRKTYFVVVNYETASRKGEPFAQLIAAKKMLPNVAKRFCTEQLKIKTMQRYMRSIGHRDYMNIIGLRYDEPSRIAKMRAKNNDQRLRQSFAPLNIAKVSKSVVGDFWRSMSFDLALDNQNGTTPLGNCDMCFLKGKKKLSSIGRDHPTLPHWLIEQEKSILKTLPENGKPENASFIKYLPYNRLLSMDISSLLDDDIQCLGCTD